MILEAVILFVKPNQTVEFENNFRLASAIIYKNVLKLKINIYY